ncbi:MAG: substrate-binding domain-containing protein [Candidatus Deferrimicrobium sp.]
MMKKFAKTLVLGAAVLGLAGSAGAATLNLNIFGASAQYLYWNAVAPDFLTSVRGCTATVQSVDPTGKHGITTGTGCTGTYDTINIRYSAKASYDGIYTVKNQDIYSTCGSTPALLNQRPIITSVTDNTLACQPIHLGASDVAGESFTQFSYGQLFGPLGGGDVGSTREFSAISTSGLVKFQPVVVPFGFFINKSVKAYTCDTGRVGNICTDGTKAADCGSVSDTCTAKPLTNITREMAVQIFSGNISKWSDFGASYFVTGDATNSIVTCLRHAGSGTHASLDYAVMNSKWGATTAQFESTSAPIVYFNDGASDEMKCINNNAGLSTPGAIGYADADQSVSSYPNVAAIAYNGVVPSRNQIRNGNYDFFSNEWLFENRANTPLGSAEDTLIGQINTFASNPANMPASKKAFWAAQGEMKYNKATDQLYPGPQAATSPQIP